MSHIAVKQPDGKWALWSTVVEGWILEDASREDIVELELERERRVIEEWLTQVEDGDIDHYPSRSYDELVEKKERTMGDGSE